MSRLRKSGRKTKGYSQPSYANGFNNDGFAVNIAGMMKDMREKVKSQIDKNKDVIAGRLAGSEAAKAKALKDKATASASDKPTDEMDDKKMNYGREEVDTFFQRKKLAEEQAAAKKNDEVKEKEKEEEAEAEKEAEKAAEAEKKREDKSQGKEIADSSDGGKGSMKDRRDAKKDAKNTAKDEKKDKIDKCKGLKGFSKIKCKSSARKDFRKDKKNIRKANRDKFKDNTKVKLKKVGDKIGNTKVAKKLKGIFCTKRRRKKGKC
tara:strand:+ start:245 stop:1033 length:789 start_codon:yes stop_codon:yes gene_type:complete